MTVKQMSKDFFFELVKLNCYAYSTNYIASLEDSTQSKNCPEVFNLMARAFSIPPNVLPDTLEEAREYAKELIDYYLTPETNIPFWLFEFEEAESESKGERRVFVFSPRHYLENVCHLNTKKINLRRQ